MPCASAVRGGCCCGCCGGCAAAAAVVQCACVCPVHGWLSLAAGKRQQGAAARRLPSPARRHSPALPARPPCRPHPPEPVPRRRTGVRAVHCGCAQLGRSLLRALRRPLPSRAQPFRTPLAVHRCLRALLRSPPRPHPQAASAAWSAARSASSASPTAPSRWPTWSWWAPGWGGAGGRQAQCMRAAFGGPPAATRLALRVLPRPCRCGWRCRAASSRCRRWAGPRSSAGGSGGQGLQAAPRSGVGSSPMRVPACRQGRTPANGDQASHPATHLLCPPRPANPCRSCLRWTACSGCTRTAA